MHREPAESGTTPKALGAIIVALISAALLLAPRATTATAPPHGDDARAMTPEDVVTHRRVSEPRISPDGGTVLFVVRETDLEDNSTSDAIWRYSADDDGVVRLTRPDGEQGSPRFSPDGDRIAFLADRSGDSQIWIMHAAGGDAREASDHGSPVSSLAWSPAGDEIAFTAPEMPSEEEAQRWEAGDDERVYMEPRGRAELWLLEPDSGEERRLLEPGLHVQEVVWSPDGDRLAITARPSTAFDLLRKTEIYLVDADGGETARLTDNDAMESGLAWTPDGAALLYTASHHRRFVNAESNLYRLDVADGGVRELAPEYEYGLADPAFAGDDTVLVTSGVRASRRLVALDPDTGTLRALGGDEADGTVGDFDVAADGRSVAYVYTDADSLPDIWVGTLSGTPASGGEPTASAGAPSFTSRRVTDLNPEARSWRLGETRAETWTSADGWEVEGLLTLPVDYEPGRRYPTMVMLHGGPEAAVTRALRPGYIDYHQVLAGRGWAVLRPNYRGGTNYGDRFLQGMNADTGGGDYEDIMAGVDHLVEIGVADPERLGVMGWSWGGISTGWIVTRTDRFAAASAGAMVSDHFSVFGQADLTYDVEYFYIGGSPYEDPHKYLRMSPIGHVTNATTPTLLLHGEEDVRCPLPQSVEFYKGLRAAGAEARLVIYPREPHVFREPRHRLDKMQREIAWFESHVLE